MLLILRIFLTFLKIGSFTFGGGYAMLPIIEHEVVDVYAWVKKEDMIDFIAISQSAPGVIGINTATLVGYKVAGVGGALVATLGMIIPSFVCIVIIALVFNEFQRLIIIQKIFSGVRAAVVALIFLSVLRIGKSSINGIRQLLIVIASAVAVVVFKVSPIIVIIISGCIGLLLLKPVNDGRRE